MKRELSIARCGLACCLCSENVTCKGCRVDGLKIYLGVKMLNGAKTENVALKRHAINAIILIVIKDCLRIR